MSRDASRQNTRIAGAIFTFAGVFFAVLAAVYNESVVARFDANPPVEWHTKAAIRDSQWLSLALAAAFLIFATLLRRIRSLRRAFGHEVVARITLAVAAFAVPVLALELVGAGKRGLYALFQLSCPSHVAGSLLPDFVLVCSQLRGSAPVGQTHLHDETDNPQRNADVYQCHAPTDFRIYAPLLLRSPSSLAIRLWNASDLKGLAIQSSAPLSSAFSMESFSV